ncbi:MAG: right-handed parallel beta-helix repeat-containing protein [Clostridia bacterium]|nr:right-handed parallel beta-helix repeat-containing protein [Clostridia bacterium]
MKNIKIKNDGTKNYTPTVRRALEELSYANGGRLEFEAGEYHFYKEGALKKFIAVSNNSACEKHIVFPLIKMKNIRIDGSGAVLVFHDITFPFAVMESERIELLNLTVDTGTSPIGSFRIGKISDEGFYLHVDKEKTPYRLENGGIIFKRENGERSGLDKKFSLHGISEWGVQYLFTGECADTCENLPAKYLLTNAEERDGGLFLKFKDENVHGLRYSEGERVNCILDGGRSSDVILLDRSRDVLIKNVTVRRGIGMGIIAQLTENIEIDGFKTDESYHGDGATLTADSIHMVNCSGEVEIRNCEISHTMDDAINIHGMYTRITKCEKDTLTVKIGHVEQYFFNPYVIGDTVKSLSDESFEYTSELRITDSALSDDGQNIVLKVERISGKEREGDLLESPYRMPNVHIHGNKFYTYPHLRISGAGNILIENNSFERAIAALLVKDLAKYWYESGRVKNLVFRNNTLKDCNALAGSAFITVDIDGVAHDKSPKIHGRVEISGNRFEGVRDKAIVAAGVGELVIKENAFVKESDRVMVIDGKTV